jgi:hypothetical protein
MIKQIALAVALATTLTLPAVVLAQGLDFKGKMKPGEYEYTIAMEMGKMAGMPEGAQGMKLPGTTFKHCITQKDIDEGNQKVLGQKRPNDKGAPDCEMKDMKQSATGASYKMICKGQMQMEMDTVMTYTPTGFKATSKMTANHGGQPMNMNQNIEVKFLGPCKS